MPFDRPAALQWNAVVREIRDFNGKPIPADIARGVYRDDTDEILSTCGPNFKPIQHGDVLDPVLQTLKDQGYEIQERAATKSNFYDLKGQKGAFVAVEEAKTGSIVRATVITGDFTQPTGPSMFLPAGPPTLLRRYQVLNSHDSTYAAQVALSYLNLVCMNGMVREDFSAVQKAKHTFGFSIAAFKAKVLGAAEMMERDTERFKLYVKTPLNRDKAIDFLRKTLAKQPDKPNGDPHWSEPLVNRILEFFGREPQTVWGLYQAMTAWATHGEMKSNANQLTGRIGRDEQIARSMRAPEFKQLTAA
jgi:hypothetical protein